MKPGDLIFVRGKLKQWYDDAIKLGETLLDHTPFEGNYTHVAIYIGGGEVAEAQGGRPVGSAPLSNYEGDYDWGELALTDTERAAIVRRAKELYGRLYNWAEIAEIGVEALTHIELPHHDTEGRLICSEYARDVIRDSVHIVLSDKHLCTPEDLSLSHYVTMHKV